MCKDELLGDFSAGQHEPASSAIKCHFCTLSRQFHRKKKKKRLSMKSLAMRPQKKKSVSNLRGGENKDFQYPVFEDVLDVDKTTANKGACWQACGNEHLTEML